MLKALKGCFLSFQRAKGLILLCLISFSINLSAKEFWSDNSFTLLYGTTFELPMRTNPDDRERYVITLSHASSNTWGNLFTFLDILQSLGEGEPNNLYGEFIPRFTVSSLLKESTKKHLEQSHITDFLVATAMEYGGAANGFNQQNYLIGPGFNLSIPYFKVFNVDFYRRFNQRWQDDFQISLVWILPFDIKHETFVYDGWLDYETPVGARPYNIHSQSQLKWDAGKSLWNKKDTFYLGTEYRFWHNKFGIIGLQEQVWQLLAQVHF